ncbi:MAG TPA: hypothetical protein VFB06_34630 [Streptosporangiaceae bacterium]|nr:hypothetical protein [Streptosporangiaceae bacterium]
MATGSTSASGSSASRTDARHRICSAVGASSAAVLATRAASSSARG